MKRTILAALLALTLAPVAPSAAAESARSLYTRTLARERVLRDARNTPTLQQLRTVVTAYERLVRRFPGSGYSDNALWQAGNLALLAHDRFHQEVDRRTAKRLLNQLKAEYPNSSLIPRIDAALAQSGPVTPEIEPAKKAAAHASAEKPAVPVSAAAPESAGNEGARKAAVPVSPGVVMIRDIKRTPLADGVRVTVEMDGESLYHSERVENPERVFFDLKGTRAVPGLQDRTLTFQDDVVREIRLGRHPQNTTRIVMDMQGIDDYSVFTLYNPFRLVIDFKRTAAPAPLVRLKPDTTTTPALVPLKPDTTKTPAPARLKPDAATPVRRKPDTTAPPSVGPRPDTTAVSDSTPVSDALPLTPIPPGPVPSATAGTVTAPAAIETVPLVSRQPASPLSAPPTVPSTNSNGQFSLARQLGLGISRVVIDAGHGGHDPGAQANGITESELVLDVALRLRKLLERQTGIDVTMTRDTDVFIPLEERTAIANREAADLFLSIHANASRNPRARGIETYFLNFATNPEAEAVAARENSASGRTMHSLPDIVRAIALNNKIDESRDFASTVQKSMVRRLAQRNRQVKDLGVKQAPFVVLIGAGMPSVLAEISFLTNRQEGSLLKGGAYRQQIAQALMDAILRYQQSLKKMTSVARTTEAR